MDTPPSTPPPPPAPAPQSPHPTPPPPPPPPPVVQVVNRAPGFGRVFVGTIGALGSLAIILIIGIGIGAMMVALAGLMAGGSQFDRAIAWETYRDGRGSSIAILPVRGVIDRTQAAFVRLCVKEILSDGNVKAVVLRVDSPGGGVTASDEIWNEVRRLRDGGLPVVASFGGVAASGGYYAACGTDYIVAQETTITGSIGVIAQVMTFEGLMEKVGIEPVTLVATRSPAKSVANDVMRAWNEADRTEVRDMLDAAYDVFHARVKTGRANAITDPRALAEIANGSSYTAQQAVGLGLVDSIGYLDDAIGQAERIAGLRPGRSTVRSLERRPTLFGGGMPGAAAAPDRRDLLDAERVRSLINDLSSVRLFYLSPAR